MRSLLTILLALSLKSALGSPGLFPGQPDARSAGLANISTIVPGLWAVNHNPALITGIEGFTVGISHNRYLLIKGLSQSSAALLVPVKRSAIGISYRNYGFSSLQNHLVLVSTGIRLHERFCSGVSIGYVHFATREKSIYSHSFSYTIGMAFSISKKLSSGFHISNPFPAKAAWEKAGLIACEFAAGMSYEPVENILLLAEYHKTFPYPAAFRLGTEMDMIRKMTLRFGVQVYPFQVSGGLSINLDSLRISLAFTMHDKLGTMPCTSIDYQFK